MRRLIAFALTFFCVLGLVGCNNRTLNEPEMYNSSMQDDFPNAIPAEVNDNIIQNCTVFSENLGYETGEMKKAVLLGEEWMKYVYCEDEMKKELIDSSDIVVIFENIRCVVDAETEIVLGSLPFVYANKNPVYQSNTPEQNETAGRALPSRRSVFQRSKSCLCVGCALRFSSRRIA